VAVWVALLVVNYLVRAVLPEFHPGSLLGEARRLATWDWGLGPARLAANATAFLTAILVPLAAAGLGGGTLAWITGRAVHGLALEATLGLGLTGAGLLGLGYAGLLRPATLAGALLLAGVAGTTRLARRTWRSSPPAGSREPELAALAWIAGAAILGWTLCALPPETEMDSLKYHLGKPQQYLLAGKIATNLSVFFKFPSLWEALLAAPLGLGGPAAAKVLQPLIVLVMAALLGSALGPAAPFGGRVAAALLVTSYGLGRLAVTAKNDILVACFALGAFAAWLHAPARRAAHGGWRLLAGLFLGFALATKYTAMLSVAMIGFLWLATRVRVLPWRVAAREAAWVAAGLLLGYLPWGAKDVLETGNPVYPFAPGVFHAGMYPPSYALLTIETHRYVSAAYDTLADKGRAVWNLATQEHLWILPALALPALAALGNRWAPGWTWMAGGAAAAVVWTIGPPQARYLLQGMTLMCGAIEWAMAPIGRTARSRLMILRCCVAIAALETVRGWGDYWSDRGARLPVAFGLLDPSDYLLEKLTTYADATRWIEAHTDPRAHVLIFGPTRTFPLARHSTLRTDYEPVPPLALAADALDDAHFARKMRQAGYTHMLFERLNAVAWGEQLAVILPPDRALARWAAWWRRHAVQVYESPRFDLRQGAFVVFDLRGTPAAGRPPLLLPGVEGWLFPPADLLRRGRPAAARAWFGRVKAVAGDIAFIRQAEVALFEARMPRADARRILKEVDHAGFRSVWLYTTLGRYAAEAGERTLAERYRARAEALAYLQVAAPEASGQHRALPGTAETGQPGLPPRIPEREIR
jgi:hypothetical protein